MTNDLIEPNPVELWSAQNCWVVLIPELTRDGNSVINCGLFKYEQHKKEEPTRQGKESMIEDTIEVPRGQ